MNITYEFIAYAGSVFKNEKGEQIDYSAIHNNFYFLDGRKGKVIYLGVTHVYEQGYSGYYANFGFVFQDDLSVVGLDKSKKVLLVSEVAPHPNCPL